MFGGSTDYPEYFVGQRVNGAVLGMAITKYCYVGVQTMPVGQEAVPGVPLRYRVQYSRVDDCNDPEDIRHPAVRAAIKYFRPQGALEFHAFGDLPGRSGLGGSSAFTVGLLLAMRQHLGLGPNGDGAEDLASEAIAFERYMIGETVGYQDQIFAATGGVLHITFHPDGSATMQRVNASPARLQELADSLLLVYSGSMRDAHVMAAKQVARVGDNSSYLERLTALADAGRVVLEGDGDLADIGALLDVGWKLKRSLTPDISSPTIDALYARGIECGAIGGKLLGAGGGGFMLFFVPAEKRERFIEAIGAPCVRFSIDFEGARTIIRE